MRFVKRDANHAAIVEVLKAFGFSVYDASHAGRSFPDLVVGYHGVTDLVEIKRDDKARLTDGQKKFSAEWRGAPVVVIRSRDEAIEWAKATRGRYPQRMGAA